ncbi:Required for meiotic nuclear division protein 1 [Grifola frondosa]|uniref:Required for meiotic nuclear division protein 1 n=1 Tax=Grifola frondosa TaxID=5627 RepID=A0A1C7M5K1_GRIFR|nr:Required for meiotic nuclear division protein 1 [Grifola frondosa]
MPRCLPVPAPLRSAERTSIPSETAAGVASFGFPPNTFVLVSPSAFKQKNDADICFARTPRHWQASAVVRHIRSRGFAQSTDQQSLPEPPKPKPKASTPLRRAASASLLIRSNPTPTRGDIRPVFTFNTAERYLLPNLRGVLPASAQTLHDSWWVPKWEANGKEGEIFVFGNGSFVCWGLGEEEAKDFASKVLEKSNAQVSPLKEPETEDLEFVTDPTENTRLQGDLIILGRTLPLNNEDSLPGNLHPSTLPQETLLARYAFSQALARSTALSGLEVSLENYLSSVALLPDALQKTGKPGLSRVALVKKLGELLKFRQGINLNRENFSDTPDFYWAEPELEGYFHSLSAALEINARTRSVNDKITYAAEMQSVLRELLTETSAHRMELIIIALIAVEVVICLIRDGPELWHMLIGKEERRETRHEVFEA